MQERDEDETNQDKDMQGLDLCQLLTIAEEKQWTKVESKRKPKKKRVAEMRRSSLELIREEEFERDLLEFSRDEGKVEDVSNGEGWIKVEMTADTGAADTVFPTEWFPEFPAKESPESRAGVHYTAAGGKRLPNRGMKDLKVVTQDGVQRNLRVQLADIKKPLFSLGRSTAKGHKVILDDDGGSYLLHKATGMKTPLRKSKGVYVLDVWVKVKDNQMGFMRQGAEQ